jgi:hypothetical protein
LQVSKQFHVISHDQKLWKDACFEFSAFERLRRQREADSTYIRLGLHTIDGHDRSSSIAGVLDEIENDDSTFHQQHLRALSKDRARAVANWDPGYPTEEVDYYQEYVHRHGKISLNWFQTPTTHNGARSRQSELGGMGLFEEYSGDQIRQNLLVAPIDDGTVGLWHIHDSNHHEPENQSGRLAARSRAGVLRSVQQPTFTPWSINPIQENFPGTGGVVECVSVDSRQKRAYFAVGRMLKEIDLETLSLVSDSAFDCSITALSEARHPIPITVGTTHTLHLHDPRAKPTVSRNGSSLELCEPSPLNLKRFGLGDGFRRRLVDPFLPFATLISPGPCSILHMPHRPDEWDGNGDIYLAGRVSGILNFDRRSFPKMRGVIHSGGRLSCLTSQPFSFTALESELRQQNKLSIEAVHENKSIPGRTLVACGEYNGKGSLELYGLSPIPEYTNISSMYSAGRGQASTLKNRQSASKTKLLSVASHGTRLVFSDGDGDLKWVERDGITEVRRFNINPDLPSEQRGLFNGTTNSTGNNGDVARKLLPVPGNRIGHFNNDDLLVWTGERVGLLSFQNRPSCGMEDLKEEVRDTEADQRAEQERTYRLAMRNALVRNADEVRFVRGLGLGGTR